MVISFLLFFCPDKQIPVIMKCESQGWLSCLFFIEKSHEMSMRVLSQGSEVEQSSGQGKN